MAIVTKQQLTDHWDQFWSQERELWVESCRESAENMVQQHGGVAIEIPHSDAKPTAGRIFRWLDKNVEPETWSQFGPYWWFMNERDATVAALRWG